MFLQVKLFINFDKNQILKGFLQNKAYNCAKNCLKYDVVDKFYKNHVQKPTKSTEY